MEGGTLHSFMNLFGHETPPQVRDMLEQKIISTRQELLWSQMATHKSKYRGWHVQCKECGRFAEAVWTPGSTTGWKDQQRAEILSFFGVQVPEIFKAPLEPRMPMV